jgi:hypothetical protein
LWRWELPTRVDELTRPAKGKILDAEIKGHENKGLRFQKVSPIIGA